MNMKIYFQCSLFSSYFVNIILSVRQIETRKHGADKFSVIWFYVINIDIYWSHILPKEEIFVYEAI